MPRTSRGKSHSKVYHCMLRGINQQDIFFNEQDYLKFIKIIKKSKEKFNYQLYSYVLMPNHIHLEIKDENQKISQIIHNNATSYANYFNKKYKRVGHLFQSRFKSKNVEGQYYMFNLVRYIHQNPVKAGISTMDKYIWSSYKEYFLSDKIKDDDKIVDTEEILEIYSQVMEKEKEEFFKFNKENIKFEKSEDVLEYDMRNTLKDEEVIYFIQETLKIYNIQEIQKYSKVHRDSIIRKISQIKGVTKAQVSRVLGINIRTIYEANKK